MFQSFTADFADLEVAKETRFDALKESRVTTNNLEELCIGGCLLGEGVPAAEEGSGGLVWCGFFVLEVPTAHYDDRLLDGASA